MKKNILTTITIILFLLLPINFTFTSLNVGHFLILYYLAFLVFWIIPSIFLYKKGYKLIYYVPFLIIYILISIILLYFGEKHGISNNKKIIERVKNIENFEN